MPKISGHSTRFDNLSDAELVDELGSLKVELAQMGAREEALKAELIARGAGEFEGVLFRATVSPETTRWTIDGAAIKAEMGDAWVLRRSKQSRVRAAVRVTSNEASAVRIAA